MFVHENGLTGSMVIIQVGQAIGKKLNDLAMYANTQLVFCVNRLQASTLDKIWLWI